MTDGGPLESDARETRKTHSWQARAVRASENPRGFDYWQQQWTTPTDDSVEVTPPRDLGSE